MNTYRRPALAATALACLMLTACGKADDPAAGSSPPAPAAGDLSAAEHKSAYAIGASVGAYIANMKQSQAEYIGDIEDAYIIQGFTDALQGRTQLDDKEIEATLSTLDARVQSQMHEKAREQARVNLDEGRSFLSRNATRKGVVTTDSGLQYLVGEAGAGDKPRLNDTISVKYRGTTLDGKVFDEQKEAVDFPLNHQMIKGWVEGIQLMSKGARYTLFIPSELAYGEDGAGDRIGPNAVLIFEVELVDFRRAKN